MKDYITILKDDMTGLFKEMKTSFFVNPISFLISLIPYVVLIFPLMLTGRIIAIYKGKKSPYWYLYMARRELGKRKGENPIV